MTGTLYVFTGGAVDEVVGRVTGRIVAATAGAAARKGPSAPGAPRRTAVCTAVSEISEGKAGESASLTGLRIAGSSDDVIADYQAALHSRYRNGGRMILVYRRKRNIYYDRA
jgi:hypothetical protein